MLQSSPSSAGTGRRLLVALLTLMAAFAVAVPSASAAGDPDHVGFTLEGCRLLTTTALPQTSGPHTGEYVCNDSEYTSGNLGKNWNELDLVPFRLTADSSGDAQTYSVVVALDGSDAGAPGYDVISVPVLNTELSDGGGACQLVSSDQLVTGGVGGIDETIYRTLTVTQAAGATCVYDYYGRLALGSHLFPGSALHANLLNQELGTAGIGARDVSIPVKEIEPQDIDKTMTARKGTGYSWSINKSVPTGVNFGNTCGQSGAALERTVSITVSWTRTVVNGDVVVETMITATNPAHRLITVDVTDNIYGGTTPAGPVLGTASTPAAGVDVPAGQADYPVLTHTQTFPAGSPEAALTDFNDVATATYTDKVTGITVPGSTQATATASVETVNNPLGATATIGDTESITGAGLQFAVMSTTGQAGAFGNGYVLGTPTTGTSWTSTPVSTSGSVTFNKKIILDSSRTTSGVLTDTATLNDGTQTLSTGAKNIAISATRDCATVKIVKRTAPAGQTDTFGFTRNVTTANGAVTSDVGLKDGETSTITDVVPNTGGAAYTAGEDLAAAGQPAGYRLTAIECFTTDGSTADTDSSGVVNGAQSGGTASIHVNPGETVTCRFTNTKLATMIVKKLTDPATNGGPSFPFTTNAPGAASYSLAHGQENTRQVPAGQYTATETNPSDPVAGYRLASITCNDADAGAAGTSGDVTTGVATYNLSPGEVVRCTYLNRQEPSAISIVKDGPATAYHGDSMTFTYVVTNPGVQSIHDVVVTDDKCSPVVQGTKTEGPNDTGAAILDPGDTWRYSCTMPLPAHTAAEADPHVNIGTASGIDEGDHPVGDDDAHAVNVLHQSITLDKTGPAEANAGENVSYTLQVKNTGDTSATQANVTFTDPRCDVEAPVRTSVNGDASPGSFDPNDVWNYRCTASTSFGQTQVTNVADVCVVDTNARKVCTRDDAVTTLRQPVQIVAASEQPAAAPAPVPAPAPIAVVAPLRIRASANLSGPAKCVRGVFKVRVLGKQIRTATVYVGLRKIRTLTKAGTVSIDPRKVGYAVQRVRVVFRFTSASGAKTRTLRAAFQRCPLRAVKPQFTG